MNPPYLFPDECPWHEEYRELMELRQYILSRFADDDGDLMSYESSEVI